MAAEATAAAAAAATVASRLGVVVTVSRSSTTALDADNNLLVNVSVPNNT